MRGDIGLVFVYDEINGSYFFYHLYHPKIVEGKIKKKKELMIILYIFAKSKHIKQ